MKDAGEKATGMNIKCNSFPTIVTIEFDSNGWGKGYSRTWGTMNGVDKVPGKQLLFYISPKVHACPDFCFCYWSLLEAEAQVGWDFAARTLLSCLCRTAVLRQYQG